MVKAKAFNILRPTNIIFNVSMHVWPPYRHNRIYTRKLFKNVSLTNCRTTKILSWFKNIFIDWFMALRIKISNCKWENVDNDVHWIRKKFRFRLRDKRKGNFLHDNVRREKIVVDLHSLSHKCVYMYLIIDKSMRDESDAGECLGTWTWMIFWTLMRENWKIIFYLKRHLELKRPRINFCVNFKLVDIDRIIAHNFVIFSHISQRWHD